MPKIKVREIRPSDLKSGFLETLANLAEVGGLSYPQASKVLRSIRANPLHKIYVAEEDGVVIGATTLVIELKFIHAGGLVGHIEDVSVRKGFEGRGVGGMLVAAAVRSARRLRCYKCILDCNEKVAEFYEKQGFTRHGLEMRMDLG